MTVYEVNTPDKIQKLKDFVAMQPEGSFTKSCWETASRKKRLRQIIDQYRESLRIFVCEDKKGKIRVAWFSIRGKYDDEGKEVSYARNLMILEHYEDVEVGNRDYVYEISAWLLKHAKEEGVSIIQQNITEKNLPYAEKIHGKENIEILREYESGGEKIYLVKIDLRKSKVMT